MEFYEIKPFVPKNKIYSFDVPASKSILNRALLLSALSNGKVFLSCGAFGGDTRAMLNCLNALGIKTELSEGGVTVYGCGGDIPVKNAALNVESAGTVARFLPSALAFCGGDYLFTSSEQMKKRPMEGLDALEKAGASVTYLGERGKFPFRLASPGIETGDLQVETNTSTQYLSGLLIAASAAKKPVRLSPHGERAEGSYVRMTLDLLNDFGIKWEKNGGGYTVFPAKDAPERFDVEGDLSGACYFYALALLFGIKVLVRRIGSRTRQGDFRFLELLKERGIKFYDTEDGLLADGEGVCSFTGFDCDFKDFSDQTLTAAALAPFASTPSVLRNVEHISRQESDRIAAIVDNINALGGSANTDGKNIRIAPIPLTGGTVKTFQDHRVAMAFTLSGLKTGGMKIENPACVGKTFEHYFDLIDRL